MSTTVLVVNPASAFLGQLSERLAVLHTQIGFKVAANRLEAMEDLGKSSYQFLITSLKIPRLSDGYRFLAQVAGKMIDADKMLVLVDEKTGGVTTSLTGIGLQHIATPKEYDEIAHIVVHRLGLAVPVGKPVTATTLTSEETEWIRKALNQVMGPVGSRIFEKALSLWGNTGAPEELIAIIAGEIGEEELIDQFQALL